MVIYQSNVREIPIYSIRVVYWKGFYHGQFTREITGSNFLWGGNPGGGGGGGRNYAWFSFLRNNLPRCQLNIKEGAIFRGIFPTETFPVYIVRSQKLIFSISSLSLNSS